MGFQPGFYVSDHLRGLIERFVIEYFACYDGPNPASTRQKLIPAYDEDAYFTLVMESIDHTRYSDNEMFMDYRRDSHNIKNMEVWRKFRGKMIQKGALNVVSRLTRLPQTKHLTDSFLVDVSFAEVICILHISSPVHSFIHLFVRSFS